MKTSLAMIMLGCVAFSACGDDRSEVQCGSGDAVAIDGQTYCVFEQAVVVENGFECPPDAPFLTRSTGFGVCGQQQVLPPALVEDIHLGWQDLRGTCVLNSECAAGQSCVASVCQTTPDQNNTNNTNNTNNVPGACGGFAGLTCETDQWCDYGGVDGQCGAADQLGTCVQRPETCTADFNPVCGCDGQTYSNACTAHASGVDIIANGECP
jgi:hypothetical protein